MVPSKYTLARARRSPAAGSRLPNDPLAGDTPVTGAVAKGVSNGPTLRIYYLDEGNRQRGRKAPPGGGYSLWRKRLRGRTAYSETSATLTKVLGILHIGSRNTPVHLLPRSRSVYLVGKWPNHNHHVAGREAAELQGEIVERIHSTTASGTGGPPHTGGAVALIDIE
jgi:hypothetical protein